MYLIYNTSTQAKGPERATPYKVDGKPGTLTVPLVELQVVRQDRPALTPGQTLTQTQTVDLAAKTLTYGWAVNDAAPQALAAINREALRQKLIAAFAAVTDPATRAAFLTFKAAVQVAFSQGESLAVIKALIASVEVGSDATLQGIKATMLGYAEWGA